MGKVVVVGGGLVGCEPALWLAQQGHKVKLIEKLSKLMSTELGGFMLSGRSASVTASQGQNLIFSVFAAAVIEGISLNGVRGRAVGALAGVLLLGTISNILILSQIPSFWIDTWFGAIILVVLLLAGVTADEKGGKRR